jgi:ribosomal protein S18 acetylase RimI-like enzyme
VTLLERSAMTVQMPIALRIATSSDLPKLEWYGQYTHYRRLFRRAFREQQAGNRFILVATSRNFPIGLIIVQLRSTETTIADGYSRAYLYSLRVMEMFRGRGIGTRLIREAESLIMDRGFQWTTIAVAKHNQGARRLYERLDYQIFKEDPGQWSYLDHRGQPRHVNEPCWLLEKNLVLR